jgi:hypothetical protein
MTTQKIKLLSVFLLVWACLSVTTEAAPFSSTVAETEPGSSVESSTAGTTTGPDESTAGTTAPDQPVTTTQPDEGWEQEEEGDSVLQSLVDARILELQTNLKYALKMRGLVKAFK